METVTISKDVAIDAEIKENCELEKNGNGIKDKKENYTIQNKDPVVLLNSVNLKNSEIISDKNGDKTIENSVNKKSNTNNKKDEDSPTNDSKEEKENGNLKAEESNQELKDNENKITQNDENISESNNKKEEIDAQIEEDGKPSIDLDDLLKEKYKASISKIPDFAVVLSFINLFSAHLELPNISLIDLEKSLETTHDFAAKDDHGVLEMLHIKLFRKLNKSAKFSSLSHIKTDKLVRNILKFTQMMDLQFAWDLEQFGYHILTCAQRLLILKTLCEVQFDENPRFRNILQDAYKGDRITELRLSPFGYEQDGTTVWLYDDCDFNLRVYAGDIEGNDSWQIRAGDLDELSEYISLLKQLSEVNPKDTAAAKFEERRIERQEAKEKRWLERERKRAELKGKQAKKRGTRGRSAKVDEEAVETSESEEEDDGCCRCLANNETDLLLLCDGCDAAYHALCLRPPVEVIPEGDWFCPYCLQVKLADDLQQKLTSLTAKVKARERKAKRNDFYGLNLNNIMDNVETRRSKRDVKPIDYKFSDYDSMVKEATRGGTTKDYSSSDTRGSSREQRRAGRQKRKSLASDSDESFTKRDDDIGDFVVDDNDDGRRRNPRKKLRRSSRCARSTYRNNDSEDEKSDSSGGFGPQNHTSSRRMLRERTSVPTYYKDATFSSDEDLSKNIKIPKENEKDWAGSGTEDDDSESEEEPHAEPVQLRQRQKRKCYVMSSDGESSEGSVEYSEHSEVEEEEKHASDEESEDEKEDEKMETNEETNSNKTDTTKSKLKNQGGPETKIPEKGDILPGDATTNVSNTANSERNGIDSMKNSSDLKRDVDNSPHSKIEGIEQSSEARPHRNVDTPSKEPCKKEVLTKGVLEGKSTSNNVSSSTTITKTTLSNDMTPSQESTPLTAAVNEPTLQEKAVVSSAAVLQESPAVAKEHPHTPIGTPPHMNSPIYNPTYPEVPTTLSQSQPTSNNQLSQPPPNKQLQSQPTSSSQLQNQPTSNRQLQNQPTSNSQFQNQPTSNRQLQNQPTSNSQLQNQPTSNSQLQNQPTASTPPASQPASPYAPYNPAFSSHPSFNPASYTSFQRPYYQPAPPYNNQTPLSAYVTPYRGQPLRPAFHHPQMYSHAMYYPGFQRYPGYGHPPPAYETATSPATNSPAQKKAPSKKETKKAPSSRSGQDGKERKKPRSAVYDVPLPTSITNGNTNNMTYFKNMVISPDDNDVK